VRPQVDCGAASCGCPVWDEALLMTEIERARAERQDRRREDPRYKTRLCRNFARNGACRFDRACMFAHGAEELDQNHR